jgi:cation transport protein ChaC
MWIFAYGSLMWDGWENKFGGTRVPGAELRGFHRSFNKASSANWGTPGQRGPTLGLEPEKSGIVVGVAFEFADDVSTTVLSVLAQREGPSFAFETLPIQLPAGQGQVSAFVPVNNRRSGTYVGDVELSERAMMAQSARGTSGSCKDYVRGVQKQLRVLSIADEYVDEFVDLMGRKQ